KGRMVAVGTAAELVAQTQAANFEDAFVALCGGGRDIQ
ncbi:MAG TPA: ABC transporter ATP-binding protein, partial [Clostridia bacterium]|nr:ABC transporter ATP-binding protein [Clostridia bacterium]